MERRHRYLLVTLAALVAALGLFSAGFALGGSNERPVLITGSGSSQPLDEGAIQDTLDKIMSSAVDPPDEDALVRGAIRGMVDVLKDSSDPYAAFFTPRGYRSLQELTTGRFSGIGVWLKTKDEELEIVSVLPDTPALEAGLRSGDVIKTVNGETLEDVDPDVAIGRIKGPEGTEVTLEIERGDETLTFTMTRAQIDLPNLQSEMRSDDVGYIRLFGFARNAGRQVRNEVEALRAEGARGIVLDLRDNGGGLFTEAIRVASVFIEDGKIVTYRAADEEAIDYDADGGAIEDLPLVVLVNEGTASASEIVAGALQDRGRATLVGKTTYGKGSVQEVVALPDASALKFTTAAYLTPDGRNINGRGIEPDVEVAARPQQDGDEDEQLERAVQVLQDLVSARS